VSAAARKDGDDVTVRLERAVELAGVATIVDALASTARFRARVRATALPKDDALSGAAW
jgi:hypothetical protein